MSIPFAVLSLGKYVNKAGTDVGFGCLLAVALLALLYFAGARETRSLRHQLEDAQNRVASLEARVAQALRNQAAARAQVPQVTQPPNVPGRPGVVAAPRVGAPASAVGGAVARVQREVALAGGATQPVTGVLLGAPAGAGAPPLGSATRLIPGPEAAPVLAPAVGLPAAVPAAATAAASASSSVGVGPATEAYAGPDVEDDEDEFEPDDTMYVPAGATAAANGGRSGGPVVGPPRTGYFDEDEDPVGPAPRRTVSLIDEAPSGSRTFRRVLGGLLTLLIIAAIVVVLLVVTNNNNSNPKTTTAARSVVTKAKRTKVVFDAARVKVSVLNGTGMTGLAGDVATLVKKSGYTVPHAAITNADVQTVTTTTVGYRPGFRDDAFRVAKSLSRTSGVAVTDVVPASSTSVTSCATPTATGQTGTCPASVIVTVGTDLESAASGSTGA